MRQTLVSAVGLMCGIALMMGCAREAAPTPASSSAAESAPMADANPEPKESVPKAEPRGVPVGDDPARSLEEVAQQVRAAVERFDRIDVLVRPAGWNRFRMAVLDVASKVEPNTEPQRGVAKLSIQPRFSLVRPTREEAAGDEDLLPRRPQPTVEERMNDAANPEVKPMELVVHYENRDGMWVRTSWDVPGKLSLGNDWLDVLGAP